MAVDVLCIGHAAYDLAFFVDDYPDENSKCETRELLESGGGPAANAAFLLSSWGIPCAFAGVAGSDRYGELVRDEFLRVGTEISLFRIRTDEVTPVSTVLINQRNASRTIVNRKVQSGQLTLSLDQLGRMQPKVLLFDGHELTAALQAMTAFPNAVSILDAGSLREGTDVLSKKVNIVAASERFAKQLGSVERCLETLRQWNPGASALLITLGENGLIYADQGACRHLPAFRRKAVDTTAAGDIFHGALAYAVLKEMEWLQQLRFASMAAALSVEKKGGRASIPALNTVLEAIQNVG